MLILFGIAIFLSAALLFIVQPMVARVVLPLLGGTPAVWNTCMVFFQALLLGGYAYAHVLTKVKRPALQVAVHAVVCLLPLAFLPVALPHNLDIPESSQPVAWLLGVLALTVGAPFFVLSATGPLLQRWFSTTDHPAAKDPYFLYAASNAGSLLALLGYPFALERLLRLREQTVVWSVAYVVLAALLIGAGVWALRRRAEAKGPAPVTTAAGDHGGIVTWRTTLLWVLLAFAPSSLMLGATSFISTNVAAVPLLWIAPLTIYLLTMILAYSKAGPVLTAIAVRAAPIALVALAMLMLLHTRRPIGLLFSVHMVALLACAMACHGRLGALRPAPERLTGYFLWISVGGVLGGIFNALVAPVVFDSVVEYPVAIVLCGALALGLGTARGAASTGRERWIGLLWTVTAPALVIASMVVLAAVFGFVPAPLWLKNSAVLGVPALACYLLSRWPAAFALTIAGLLVMASREPAQGVRTLFAGRSFFGVQKVVVIYDTVEGPRGPALVPYFHQLVHGDTIHGRQCVVEGRQDIPVSYFHPEGPIGRVFEALKREPGRVKTIAVIGLGAGAIAAYGERGQRMTFYEIDPAIREIAGNPDYFSYLARGRASVDVVIGDGRLALAAESEPKYDLIILDAFSSDAIPIHLLTVEAFGVYLSRLSERGLIVVHTSNRHLNLPPVVAAAGARMGLTAVRGSDTVDDSSPEARREGRFGSEWVVLARQRAELDALFPEPFWSRLPAGTGTGTVWSDDFSSILDVIDLWGRGRGGG